jgi:hypothetical protein
MNAELTQKLSPITSRLWMLQAAKKNAKQASRKAAARTAAAPAA